MNADEELLLEMTLIHQFANTLRQHCLSAVYDIGLIFSSVLALKAGVVVVFIWTNCGFCSFLPTKTFVETQFSLQLSGRTHCTNEQTPNIIALLLSFYIHSGSGYTSFFSQPGSFWLGRILILLDPGETDEPHADYLTGDRNIVRGHFSPSVFLFLV